MWKFLASDGFVCVGFALAGDADVGAYHRCKSYRLHTTTAQATVWIADDIQETRPSWIDPTENTTVALIGNLCETSDR